VALRLYLLAAVLSLLSGCTVFFLFRFFAPSDTGAGYAVVSVDASLDDRSTGVLLDSAGLEGGYFSESTQWIEIDDFGTLRKIPLDTYSEEIESFDPRDDGFAEKLKGFFVRDGRRFFFLPLADSAADGKKLKNAVSSALENIPFDFEILGYYRPFFPCLVLLVPSVLAALLLSGFPPGFVFQVSPLLGFAAGGPPALVLAALLASFWALFRDPLNELFAASRYSGSFYAGRGFRGGGGREIGEKLKPYGFNLVLILVFLLLFGFAAVMGDLPLLPVSAGLVSSWGLSVLARAAETERQKKAAHVRFNPVIMLPGRVKSVPLFPVAAVFGPAVLLSLLAPQLFPSLSYPKEAPLVSDPRFLISPAGYEEHIAFERAFSRRPLGSYARGSGYLHYYLGEDGLIAGTRDDGQDGGEGRGEGEEEEIPSFPLENLMEFLLQYNKGAEEAAPAQGKKWPAVLFLLALIPAFFFRSKKASYFLESVS
jgi:hypothetical protein